MLGYNKGKPLPERTNIVVTRDANYSHEGVVVAHSLDEAIEKAKARSIVRKFTLAAEQPSMSRYYRK